MVKLRTLGLSQAYRHNLREGWAWAAEEFRQRGFRLSAFSDPVQLDRVLEKVIQGAYDEGEKCYKVRLAVVAVQRKLRISGALLRSSWAALKGWMMSQPSRPRVPITKYLLEAVVVSGLSKGACEVGFRRRRWVAAALGWWLSFDALLRPMETLRLRRCDLAFPPGEGNGGDPNVVVVVQNPKTRRVWKTQFVLCTDVALIRWLQWWCEQLKPHDLVVGLSRHQWASLLKQVCCLLCIDDIGYTLSSFRSGGATHHFRMFENLGTLQYRGRWSNPNTLQYYLHEAMSAHVTCRMSQLGRTRTEAVREGVKWLNSAPRSPATNLFSW